MKKLDLPPQLTTGAIVFLFAALGCVNRGQHAPMRDAGVGGVDIGDGQGGGNVDAPIDNHGVGGSDGGSACIIVDGGADAGDAGLDAAVCNSTFNFENCLTYSAAIYKDPFTATPEAFAAFTSLSHTEVASCGFGALAIGAQFSPTQTRGEVKIPVAAMGSVKDYSGRTLTVSVRGDPANNLPKIYVLLLSTTGYMDLFASFPFRSEWTTRSTVLPLPSALDMRIANITDIVVQATGPPDGGVFTGTIYVDEIDVRFVPDAGATDGGATPDGGAPDTRGDAGGDVRDAPSG